MGKPVSSRLKSKKEGKLTMPGLRSALFAIILVAYLAIGALFVFLTPNWQAPDEPAHYNYVRYLATEPGFPELVAGCYNQNYLNRLTSRRFPPELPINNVCYEFHQPPLYYLLGMPVFLLGGGWPVALRLLSVALGGGVVALAFLTGRTIFPQRPEIAYGTMAFVAFVPMHVAILASVNNDALAELILAALLLLLTRRLLLVEKASRQGNLLLGALLGIGLLTKTTVYIAIPLLAVTLWLTSVAGPKEPANDGTTRPGVIRDWARLVKQAGLIYGLALLIALPWYIRNARLYGDFDILGLARHDTVVVGQLRTGDYLAEAGGAAYLSNFATTTFHSFWGQFGWMAVPMDGRVYLALTLLSLIALGGLIGLGIEEWRPALPALSVAAGSVVERLGIFGSKASTRASGPHTTSPARSLSTGQRRALGLMALTIILMALAYVGYNLTFVQFQGRYLFPALIPLGLLFSLGLSEAFSRRWLWWPVGGLAGALVWVVVASVFKGDLDRWAALITGLAFALAAGRALLARCWWIPTWWLVVVCYTGLGLLALASPFWFVRPYLAP